MIRRLKDLIDLGDEYPSLGQSVWNLGLAGYWRFRVARREIRTTPKGNLVPLKSRHAQHPLYCRAGSSDFKVFNQIFICREYSCIDDAQAGNGLIIDCGANVGYSSAYFLSRFPRCTLIAVEPDADNFKLLNHNLQPYGKRARSVEAAVWSHPTRLAFSETPYRDGLEWARQVRECQPDELSGLKAVDIASLLKESGQSRIAVLKMDIEGAEGVVFAKNFESWIDLVDTMVIEVHDDTMYGDCTTIVSKAMADRDFSLSRYGELHVFKRKHPRKSL